VTEPKIELNPLSCSSLYVTQSNNGTPIATATGFVVESNGIAYLITNWHVVTGRHPDTNDLVGAAEPDELRLMHHGKTIGTWVESPVSLFDGSGNRTWIEHTSGSAMDVVAVPLQVPPNATIYPLPLTLADTDMIPEVAMPCSIIGFPLGLTGPGVFPIWKTGHIASEPLLDTRGKPVLLIDATTRGGMSGSPVVLRLSGGFRMRSGGTMIGSAGYRTKFLGVYSGRLRGDSNIGRVWKPTVVSEILANGP